MITHSEEGPDRDPDDPLTVLLRPPSDYLGVPPGRYEAIRRGAARRKVLRAAAGAALTVGVAALVVLPLRPSASGTHRSPTTPMAPPSATIPVPERSASPTTTPRLVPTTREPSGSPSETARPTEPATRAVPSYSSPSRPAASRSSGASATRDPAEPSAVPTRG
ncbi:hypothetical protein [Streptomyces canus]|uniref:hypothetical protein n=1 Tax=Streptomyces canus TaxID=58343 RepID=UPI0003791DC8|nr:hypothetical protein [Streptomyces canus]